MIETEQAAEIRIPAAFYRDDEPPLPPPDDPHRREWPLYPQRGWREPINEWVVYAVLGGLALFTLLSLSLCLAVAHRV